MLTRLESFINEGMLVDASCVNRVFYTGAFYYKLLSTFEVNISCKSKILRHTD